MRLLIANCNTTQAITAHMGRVARAFAAPGTEIVETTAPFGAAVIASRPDMAVSEHATLAMLAAAAAPDGVLIAASLDSALRAARAMLPCPVVGLTESALHTACLLGGRFGLLTPSRNSATITREMVEAYGLGARLAGLRWLATSPQEILDDPSGAANAMAPHALALVEQDLAEVVVLVGAVMAGLPPLLQPQVPVPVLEGVSCAIPLLEGLSRLRVPKPTVGTFAAPLLPPQR